MFFSGFFQYYDLKTNEIKIDYDAIEFFHIYGIGGRLVGDVRELMYHDGSDFLNREHEEDFDAIVEQAKDSNNVKKVIYCVTYAEDEDGVEPESIEDADYMNVYCLPQGIEILSDTIAILEYSLEKEEFEEIVRIQQ